MTRSDDAPHYELRLVKCPLGEADAKMQEAVKDGFELHTFTLYHPPMAVSGPVAVFVMERAERDGETG